MAAVLDDLDVENTEEPVFEYEYLVDDLDMLAKYYIDLYFCDKTYPDGSSIPKKVLHSKHNISRVLNMDVCNSMELVYKTIGVEYSNDEMRHFERQGQLPDDVKYVIAMLHDCSRRGIPKQFAVGIFVMYLELCEGHKLAGD